MRSAWGTVLALGFFLVSGCNPASNPSASGQAETNNPSGGPASGQSLDPLTALGTGPIFPVDVGDQWTYNSYSSVGNGPSSLPTPVVLQVVSVNQTTAGTEAKLKLAEESIAKDLQTWIISSNQLIQLSEGVKGVRYAPKQVLAVLPLREGNRTNWIGTGQTPSGQIGFMKIVNTVGHVQLVDTGLGPMEAVPIVSSTAFYWNKHPSVAEATLFLKPGSGIVRYSIVIHYQGKEFHNLLELKNRTIKQS